MLGKLNIEFIESIKGLTGKINFSVGRNQRALQKLLKKMAKSNSDMQKIEIQNELSGLIANKKLTKIGKASSKLLETALQLNVYISQISSMSSIDELISLCDNLVAQKLDLFDRTLTNIQQLEPERYKSSIDKIRQIEKILHKLVDNAESLFLLKINLLNERNQLDKKIEYLWPLLKKVNNIFEISEFVKDTRNSSLIEIESRAQKNKIILFFLSVAVCIILAICFIVISKSVLNPLNKFIDKMSKFSEGQVIFQIECLLHLYMK